jgi:hypothetical protein
MRVNFSKRIVLLVIAFCFSLSSMASWSLGWWGAMGHRIVGQVAESYLTPKAKKAIKAILGDESLAISCVWADFIRSDPNYRYLSTWHYINLKTGLNRNDVEAKLLQDTAANLFNKTNFIISELKNKQLPADKKLLYLRLLIHFVGDIHQPLHAGRPDDAGGNRIRVTWFGDSTNLHTVWDEKLPEFQNLSYTEFATSINHTKKKQRTEWQKQPIMDWFFESYQLAEQIYNDIQPNQRLSYDYNFKHVGTINDRLLKGGVRLAGLLNEIFG